MHHEHTVVQIEHAVLELRLAKSGTGDDLIEILIVFYQIGLYGI